MGLAASRFTSNAANRSWLCGSYPITAGNAISLETRQFWQAARQAGAAIRSLNLPFIGDIVQAFRMTDAEMLARLGLDVEALLPFAVNLDICSTQFNA